MAADAHEDMNAAWEEFAALANKHQLAPHELLAVLAGEDVVEVRAQTLLRTKLRADVPKYLNTSVEQWPFSQIDWDISKESQRFSLDGSTRRDFAKHHSNGFELGWVATAELNGRLCAFSHRADDELWTVGFPTKLAYLVAYIANGGRVSPPIIKPLEDRTIILTGGHHRYAIAWALRLPRIPIHAYHEHKVPLSEILNIEWTTVDA